MTHIDIRRLTKRQLHSQENKAMIEEKETVFPVTNAIDSSTNGIYMRYLLCFVFCTFLKEIRKKNIFIWNHIILIYLCIVYKDVILIFNFTMKLNDDLNDMMWKITSQRFYKISLTKLISRLLIAFILYYLCYYFNLLLVKSKISDISDETDSKFSLE